MLKFSRFTAVLPALLLALTTGCSSNQPQAAPQSSIPTPSAMPLEPTTTPESSQTSASLLELQHDAFQDALDMAIGAATIAQSSTGKGDWDLVVDRWQESIKLLRTVPKSNSNYEIAQKKIKEYQQNLNAAQENVKKILNASSGVTQQALNTSPNAKPNQIQSGFTTSGSLAVPANPTEVMQAFTEQYFDATINKGSNGDEYWCSDFTRPGSVFSPVSIIASRSWILLNIELESRGANRKDGRGDFIGSITTRVASSNRGGTPIINNWVFNIIKEKPNLKNTFPGRYCITALGAK